MKKKAMEMVLIGVSALIGSMIYSLFGFIGIMLFASVALIITAYITNKMIEDFKADAQLQLKQLKDEFSQTRE